LILGESEARRNVLDADAAVVQTVSAINNIAREKEHSREERGEKKFGRTMATIENAAKVNAAKNAAVVDRVS